MDWVFLFKGIILTEILTNAAREWEIFNKPRAWIKGRSDFARRLLGCFECSAVHSGVFVFLYLSYFEIGIVTYTLIFHRLACFIKIFYLILDWSRANKEEDFMRKISGKEN